MYMKKIHQFLSSTKKKHEKRKLVLFFCLTVYIKLHRFVGAHQRNKVVKNLAMPPPKKTSCHSTGRPRLHCWRLCVILRIRLRTSTAYKSAYAQIFPKVPIFVLGYEPLPNTRFLNPHPSPRLVHPFLQGWWPRPTNIHRPTDRPRYMCSSSPHLVCFS